MRQAGRINRDANQRRRRHDRNHHRLVRKIDGVQDAERRAGISDVREVQQPRDDRRALVKRQRAPDDRFRQLIQRDDHQRQPDFDPAGASARGCYRSVDGVVRQDSAS